MPPKSDEVADGSGFGDKIFSKSGSGEREVTGAGLEKIGSITRCSSEDFPNETEGVPPVFPIIASRDVTEACEGKASSDEVSDKIEISSRAASAAFSSIVSEVAPLGVFPVSEDVSCADKIFCAAASCISFCGMVDVVSEEFVACSGDVPVSI